MTSTDLEPAPTRDVGLFEANLLEQATHIAGELKTVIQQQRLFVKISGRDHVLVEGWTLLGTFLKVHPYTVWSRPIERDGTWVGFEARVEARTYDGHTVGAAEAECTTDERQWKARDPYALRSMAQTRATSKALRQPLGFVMSLAGFDPTPADEMPRHTELRQRIVLGPEVADPPPPDPEPGPDFGPVEDPALEQIDEPTTFKVPDAAPIGAKSGIARNIWRLQTILDKAGVPGYDKPTFQATLGSFYGTETVGELTNQQAVQLLHKLDMRCKENSLTQ